MVCVYLPTAGVNPLYGHRTYHPIYQAAQELGLPVSLHGLAMCHPTFPCQLEQFDEVGRHGFGHALQMSVNFYHLMCNGIPVRFPDLKISFNEGGLAWVPWMMMRLNNEYLEWRGRLLPFYKERPSHYLRNFRFSTQPAEEPEHPRDYQKLLDLIATFSGTPTTSSTPPTGRTTTSCIPAASSSTRCPTRCGARSWRQRRRVLPASHRASAPWPTTGSCQHRRSRKARAAW